MPKVAKVQMTLGEWIKSRRETLDLKQSEIAATTKLSVGTISNIERGDSTPNRSTLRTIGAALKVDGDLLATWIKGRFDFKDFDSAMGRMKRLPSPVDLDFGPNVPDETIEAIERWAIRCDMKPAMWLTLFAAWLDRMPTTFQDWVCGEVEKRAKEPSMQRDADSHVVSNSYGARTIKSSRRDAKSP